MAESPSVDSDSARIRGLTVGAKALLAALSGVLACLSFPSYSLTPLIFIAFVPLLVAVSHRPPTDPSIRLHWARRLRGTGFALGWLTGAVGHGLAFRWALPTIARFEHISTLAALPFFALFIGYYALQVALFAAGVAWVAGRRPLAHSAPSTDHSPMVFVATWWVLLEWAFPKLIPWSLGDTLAGSAILRQGADVAGVYGLSFFVMLVNASVAETLTRVGAPLARRLRPLGAGVALVGVAMVYRAVRVHQFNGRGDGSFARTQVAEEARRDPTIAIVQGGLHSGRDDLVPANEEAWATYSSLSSRLSAPPTLIVWPETVLRVYLRQDDLFRRRVSDLVERLQRPLFLGSLDLPAGTSGELNSGYLVSPGSAMQIYHKQTLTPFGEYVPGIRLLPWLSRWRTTGRFVPEENRPQVLTLVADSVSGSTDGSLPDEHEPRTRVTRFAPSICFEAVWPGAFNGMVREGAAFLINLTDDGWFGEGAEPYQHLQAATLRAVETRRWLVRASNSGVSAFIDPTGRIVASLPLGAVGVLRHQIELSQVLSPYVRFGNWFVVVCVVVDVV